MELKIQKWGNSHGVRLPSYILKSLDLKENDTLKVEEKDYSIILSKTPRKRLKERFDNYNGTYECSEYDFGEPRGKEIW